MKNRLHKNSYTLPGFKSIESDPVDPTASAKKIHFFSLSTFFLRASVRIPDQSSLTLSVP